MSQSIPPLVDGEFLGHLYVTLKQLKGPITNQLKSFSISGKIKLWGDDTRDLDHKNTIRYDLKGTWDILHQYFLDSSDIPIIIALRPLELVSCHELITGYIDIHIPFDSLLRYLRPKVKQSSIILEVPITFNSDFSTENTIEIEISLMVSEFCQEEAINCHLVNDFESLGTENGSILSEVGFNFPANGSKSRNCQTPKTIFDNFIESKDLYDIKYPIDLLDVVPQIRFDRKIEKHHQKSMQVLVPQDGNSSGVTTPELKPDEDLSPDRLMLDSDAAKIQKWWRCYKAKKNEKYKILHRSATIIQCHFKKHIKEYRHEIPFSVAFSNVSNSSNVHDENDRNKTVNEFTIQFDEVIGLRELVLVWELVHGNPIRNKVTTSGLMVSFSGSAHGSSHFISDVTKIDSLDRAIFQLKSSISGECYETNLDDSVECYLWIVPNSSQKMSMNYTTARQDAQGIPKLAKKLCYFRCPLISLSDQDDRARCYLCPLSVNFYPLLEMSASVGSIKVIIGPSEKIHKLNAGELIDLNDYKSDDSYSFDSIPTQDGYLQMKNDKPHDEFNIEDVESLSEGNARSEKTFDGVHVALSPIHFSDRSKLSFDHEDDLSERNDTTFDISTRDLSSLLESMDNTTQALINNAMPKEESHSSNGHLGSTKSIQIRGAIIHKCLKTSSGLSTSQPKEDSAAKLETEAKISTHKERPLQSWKEKNQTKSTLSPSTSSQEPLNTDCTHLASPSPIKMMNLSSAGSYSSSSFSVSSGERQVIFDDLSLSSSSSDNTRYHHTVLGNEKNSKSESSIIDDDSSDISSIL